MEFWYTKPIEWRKTRSQQDCSNNLEGTFLELGVENMEERRGEGDGPKQHSKKVTIRCQSVWNMKVSQE